ncbi:hypothetical protein [Iamia sp.]|uniref:hypothetical protein n=1 Tax=Iamia sp. TaxID=2722710 RepID=UPI002BDECA24|nr:hypothetical protein [Iamia sp.]HXH56795.1 hypothetical protein [Iamia sp.]
MTVPPDPGLPPTPSPTPGGPSSPSQDPAPPSSLSPHPSAPSPPPVAVDPGPAPRAPGRLPGTGPSAPPSAPVTIAPAEADRGGWATTASQGLLLGRWVAAELAAQRVEGIAIVAWITGAIGLLCLGASIPVDPGWPLILLGVVLVLIAGSGRLALALAAAVLRRLALPRRARHLRPEAAAARARLREAIGEAGVPVTFRAAVRFVAALARGHQPHAGVAGNVRELARRLGHITEVERLRTLLAEAAPVPPWLARRAGAGPSEEADGRPGDGEEPPVAS